MPPFGLSEKENQSMTKAKTQTRRDEFGFSSGRWRGGWLLLVIPVAPTEELLIRPRPTTHP